LRLAFTGKRMFVIIIDKNYIVLQASNLWFLKIKRYNPGLYPFAVGVVAIYTIWFILKFFLPFHIVQPVNKLQALLSFFLVGFISIQAGRKGNRFGYYFALTGKK